MVLENSDIHRMLLPNPALVFNDPLEIHSFTLAEEEFRNGAIERMYGPFDNSINDNNTSPNGSPRPVINGSLRPIMRNEDSTLKKRQDAIDDLKRLIAERTARNVSIGKTLFTKKTDDLRLGPDETDREKAKQEKLSKVNNTLVLKESSSIDNVEKKKPAPFIVIDDSDDDDMSIDSEHSSDSVNSKISAASSSHDTFYSATDQLFEEAQMEEDELNEESQLIQANINKLNNELKELQSSSKEIRVKLLGIKVRMSMNKNRNELKNKPASLSTTEVLPKLSSKRDFSASFSKVDNNNINNSTPPVHRTARRRFDYYPPEQHQQMNYYGYNNNNTTTLPTPPPASFHQQYIQPHPQPIYVPSHHQMSVQQQQQQPPPPPSGLPPTIPPPPPPPPPPTHTNSFPAPASFIKAYSAQQQRRKVPIVPATAVFKPQINNSNLPKPTINEVLSDIEPMKDPQQINSTLKEIEQYILLRIFNDTTDHPTIEHRSLARPVRLVTVDGYTMPMTMIILNREKDLEVWEPPTRKFILPAGIPLETEMEDSWYESPFFVMLRRRAMGQSSTENIDTAIADIIESVPVTDDLSSIKIESFYFVNLENVLQKLRSYSYQDPKNEFYAALKLELSFYVYGNTKLFMDDYKQITTQLPLSIDVEWQRIRAEVTFSSQLPLILDLLHRISLNHTSFDSKESSVSSITAEVLIRLLRLNGLQQILRLITSNEIEIDTEKAEIFDIDDSTGLYLQEQDKYVVWMLILYYYVNRTLPETVCNNWMNGLVKDGKPTKNLSLFMIDWSTCRLIEQPLDRSTLFGATNILLSMLRHFGNKACNDVRRKPLLVGVWRTLFNFLSHIPNYKNAGTLMLVRKAVGIIKQVPETQEIIAALEIRAGNPGVTIVDNVYAAKNLMSLSNLYSLAYHVTRTYYEKNPFNNHHLLVISNILYYPLLDSGSREIQTEIMGQLTRQEPETVAEERVYVETIRRRYLTALGIDYLLTSNAVRQSRSEQQANLRKIAFAWINLLLLTAISNFLYPETSNIRESLDRNIKKIFEEAMEQVEPEDGKLTIFKYSNVLQH